MHPELSKVSAPAPSHPSYGQVWLAHLKSKRGLLSLAFLVLGGLAGFAYYRFVGCSSGGCAITSNPYMSTLYGAAIGFLVSGGWVSSPPPGSRGHSQ